MRTSSKQTWTFSDTEQGGWHSPRTTPNMAVQRCWLRSASLRPTMLAPLRWATRPDPMSPVGWELVPPWPELITADIFFDFALLVDGVEEPLMLSQMIWAAAILFSLKSLVHSFTIFNRFDVHVSFFSSFKRFFMSVYKGALSLTIYACILRVPFDQTKISTSKIYCNVENARGNRMWQLALYMGNFYLLRHCNHAN